jgi:TatD DNase family protein
MHLIDTHAHIYLPEFDNDRDEVISRSIDSGVERILLPNIDLDSVDPMMSLARQYPDLCHPMMGLHPGSVKQDFIEDLDKIQKHFELNKFIAVGEIGIDLYWDTTFKKEQEEAFRAQLDMSIKYELPAVIHCRNSFPEVLSIVESYEHGSLKGVFHAFTGDAETARKITAMGFYLGIGGIVTFKNSGIDRVIAEIGPQKLVLETDSPYLAPTPNRGKRNECSYLGLIALKIAEICDLPLSSIAEQTTTNAVELFNL